MGMGSCYIISLLRVNRKVVSGDLCVQEVVNIMYNHTCLGGPLNGIENVVVLGRKISNSHGCQHLSYLAVRPVLKTTLQYPYLQMTNSSVYLCLFMVTLSRMALFTSKSHETAAKSTYSKLHQSESNLHPMYTLQHSFHILYFIQ